MIHVLIEPPLNPTWPTICLAESLRPDHASVRSGGPQSPFHHGHNKASLQGIFWPGVNREIARTFCILGVTKCLRHCSLWRLWSACIRESLEPRTMAFSTSADDVMRIHISDQGPADIIASACSRLSYPTMVLLIPMQVWSGRLVTGRPVNPTINTSCLLGSTQTCHRLN